MSRLPFSPLTDDEVCARWQAVSPERSPWRCLDLCHALRVRLAGGVW